MTIHTDIMNALNNRLSELPSLPSVAWPNTELDPVIGTMFLRANILPADASTATLQSLEQHTGVYQVDIFAPVNTGLFNVNNMADSIADHFRASAIPNIRIRAITIERGDRDGAWFVVPVSIIYDTYHNRS